MQRPLPEVLASQDQMLRHRGTYWDGGNPAAIAAAFEKHLSRVLCVAGLGRNVKALRVPYHEALSKRKRQPEDRGISGSSAGCRGDDAAGRRIPLPQPVITQSDLSY